MLQLAGLTGWPPNQTLSHFQFSSLFGSLVTARCAVVQRHCALLAVHILSCCGIAGIEELRNFKNCPAAAGRPRTQSRISTIRMILRGIFRRSGLLGDLS